MKAIFAKDSTPVLIKKFMCYKLMSSDLFINSSYMMLSAFYKVLGVRATNFLINKTIASLFTSGESI